MGEKRYQDLYPSSTGCSDFLDRYSVHRKIILKFYGNLELTKRHEPVSYLILNIFLPLKDIFHQISLKKVVTFISI